MLCCSMHVLIMCNEKFSEFASFAFFYATPMLIPIFLKSLVTSAAKVENQRYGNQGVWKFLNSLVGTVHRFAPQQVVVHPLRAFSVAPNISKPIWIFHHPAVWQVHLWDDMPLNSPKRPPYRNSTSTFDYDHITAVDMSFCTSLQNFIEIGLPLAEKNDVMSTGF